jgi:hypothetical protein
MQTLEDARQLAETLSPEDQAKLLGHLMELLNIRVATQPLKPREFSKEQIHEWIDDDAAETQQSRDGR